MGSAISTIIVVAGTILATILGALLGTVGTYFLQERSARRAEGEESRVERRDAYSAYLTALAEFRRGELDRYDPRLNARDSDTVLSVLAESSRLQSAAQAALSRVMLAVGDNAELEAAARDAFEETLNLRSVRNRDDLSAQDERVKAATDRFTVLARAQVQPVAQDLR